MGFTEKTFGKSKEDFLWFVKKAIADKSSAAYGELFQKLLKIFVNADTNRDGLVSKASFLTLITGFVPEGTTAFATDAEKTEACDKMFNMMDLKHSGVITFDEWLKFCLEHIEAKVATLDPHPILNAGTKDEFKTSGIVGASSVVGVQHWGMNYGSMVNCVRQEVATKTVCKGRVCLSLRRSHQGENQQELHDDTPPLTLPMYSALI